LIRLEDYLDLDVMECLITLRDEVHSINKTMVNSFARNRVITGEMLPTATFEGMVYGIKIKEVKEGLQEEILAKPEDGTLWAEMSNTDKLSIIGSIFSVFMDRGYTDHDIEVKQGCFIFRQTFPTAHLVETNKGLVTNAGGVNLDKRGVVIPFQNRQQRRHGVQ
jgi:hypothetical protein